MTKVLLAGAGGLLGSHFASALQAEASLAKGAELMALSQAELVARLASSGAAVLINCAAHTAVDAAEADPAIDRAANALLPHRLGLACAELGLLMVQISSTGCYGEWKNEPYVEVDPLRPTTAHHRAKAEGEDFVRQSGCRHVIARTGWLFGDTAELRRNFVLSRVLEARGKTEMFSDAVQRGNPTYAGDVVAQLLALVEGGFEGTFNVVSHGPASRYDYVAKIVALAGAECQVLAGPAFKRLAQVSKNESAINRRLDELGQNAMPAWEHALAGYMSRSALEG